MTIRTNEIVDCIIKYFYSVNEEGKLQIATLPQNFDFGYAFFNNFNSGKLNFRDSPDAYMFFKNFMLIIEHFEYNSSPRTKKGSSKNIEIAKIDKNFELALKNKANVVGNERLNIKYTAKDLVNNLLYGFQKHLPKVKEYKQNLITDNVAKKDTKFKTCFWCEDTTILGNLYENKRSDKLELLNILCIKEVLDYLEEIEFDYIFFFNSSSEKKLIQIMTKYDIPHYREKQIPLTDIEILNSNPMSLTFSFTIPKSADD